MKESALLVNFMMKVIFLFVDRLFGGAQENCERIEDFRSFVRANLTKNLSEWESGWGIPTHGKEVVLSAFICLILGHHVITGSRVIIDTVFRREQLAALLIPVR